VKAQQYEGYIITDEIRIGNTRFAIGASKSEATPYVTLESSPTSGYMQPHFLLSRIAAEVDLLKRATMQMQSDLKELSVDMQTMLRKVGDAYE